MTVRKQKVDNSLVWLLNNKPQFSEVLVIGDALNFLPENGLPSELMTVATGNDVVSDDNTAGDKHYRAKIVTKRNDSRLNNYQQLQLPG